MRALHRRPPRLVGMRTENYCAAPFSPTDVLSSMSKPRRKFLTRKRDAHDVAVHADFFISQNAARHVFARFRHADHGQRTRVVGLVIVRWSGVAIKSFMLSFSLGRSMLLSCDR